MILLKYTGANDNNQKSKKFRIRKIYHSLEKSLSFQNRDKSRGRDVLNLLKNKLKQLKENSISKNAAIEIVENFDQDHFDGKYGGVSNYKHTDVGIPSKFFETRKTIRRFSPKIVDILELKEIVTIANNTPSSCNRRPWKCIRINNQDIKKVLDIQGGARGFEQDIHNLVCIVADLNAYDAGVERQQHLIDCSLFAMSFMWVLHSKNYGTYSLNWSKSISDDKKMHKLLNIKNNFRILMFVAFGEPLENQKVCKSTPDTIEDYFEES